MKSKILWSLLAAFLFALSAPAASRSNDKIQVIYRAQGAGTWQLYVFGADPCLHPHLVYPTDPGTQPLEVTCDK